MDIHKHIHTYIQILVWQTFLLCVCVFVCMYAHTHTYFCGKYIFLHAYTADVVLHACIYIYKHTHVYTAAVVLHTRIYIYTHICIHCSRGPVPSLMTWAVHLEGVSWHIIY